MSVPVNQRSHGKLEACVKAHALCVYTLRITSNKKVFTEEYSAFTAKIADKSTDIHSEAWAANNILVNLSTAEGYRERRDLQNKAANDCNLLLSYIDIAKNLYHLDTKRVKYWGGLVIETRNLIRAWRDADAKRYGMSGM